MKKVIFTMALASALLVWGAVQIFQLSPTPVANSVIAEKPSNGIMGGQVAHVLPANMTAKQHRLMNMAYEVGKQNGFRNPEIVQAVLLQETHAGGMHSYKVANPGPNAYFGPMQIKLSAARDVLARSPELFAEYNFHTRTDDEVKANLILNERFNIEVATRYLMILKDEYGFSGRQLMNAYNRGPGGVKAVDDTYHYAIGAERKLAALKRGR